MVANLRAMTPQIRRILAGALLLFPSLFIIVFVLHFRGWGDFLNLKTHYVPRDPAQVVAALIRNGTRAPLIHDPHVIAYLSLPLLLAASLALFAIGQRKRPNAAAAALVVTLAGTVYMGGVFGMWTAFYRGIGQVDPSQLAGATATFTAMTNPTRAFLLTTTLAKLTMVGFGLQGLVLLGIGRVPRWSPVIIAAGAVLFIAFWDLDNWMLVASLMLLAGFVPLRREILSPDNR